MINTQKIPDIKPAFSRKYMINFLLNNQAGESFTGRLAAQNRLNALPDTELLNEFWGTN